MSERLTRKQLAIRDFNRYLADRREIRFHYDKRKVKNVVSAVVDLHKERGEEGGMVTLPYHIGKNDRRAARRHLDIHHGNLGGRIVIFNGIQLENGESGSQIVLLDNIKKV